MRLISLSDKFSDFHRSEVGKMRIIGPILLVAFVFGGTSTKAGGLLGEAPGSSVGKELYDANRNLQNALPNVSKNRSLEQSTICWTEIGNCPVTSSLKGAGCFCIFGTSTVYGRVQ
jgi:hypothetical protein